MTRIVIHHNLVEGGTAADLVRTGDALASAGVVELAGVRLTCNPDGTYVLSGDVHPDAVEGSLPIASHTVIPGLQGRPA